MWSLFEVHWSPWKSTSWSSRKMSWQIKCTISIRCSFGKTRSKIINNWIYFMKSTLFHGFSLSLGWFCCWLCVCDVWSWMWRIFGGNYLSKKTASQQKLSIPFLVLIAIMSFIVPKLAEEVHGINIMRYLSWVTIIWQNLTCVRSNRWCVQKKLWVLMIPMSSSNNIHLSIVIMYDWNKFLVSLV